MSGYVLCFYDGVHPEDFARHLGEGTLPEPTRTERTYFAAQYPTYPQLMRHVSELVPCGPNKHSYAWAVLPNVEPLGRVS